MKKNKYFLASLFVMLGFLWGGSFVAIKYVLEVFDPWFSAVSRLLIASLTLYILFLVQKKSIKLPLKTAWKIWVTGLFTMGLPFSLLFWGEQYVSAGLAGMTNGTTPLWTALFVVMAIREERELLKYKSSWIGLSLGFLGIVLLFYPLVSADDFSQIYGGIAVLLMAISYALGNVLNRIFFSGNPHLKVSASAFHQHIASFIYLALGCFLFGNLPMTFDWSHQATAWLCLVYLGVFSTALAILVYFFLIKEWGAVKTSSVTYIVPIFAVALDFAFMGTKPHLISLLGVVVILVGIFFVRSVKPPVPAGAPLAPLKAPTR